MAKADNKHKRKDESKKMLVRYGKMGQLGWFEHNESQLPKAKTHVMVKTERGLEMGEVVGQHCYKTGAFRKSCEQVKEYFGEGAEEYPLVGGGTFVRYATSEDINEERHINKDAKEELRFCKKVVKELNLPMKLVDAEHLFGGERIIFYFTAEGRVDFRDLVKQLAKEYQTRIEMRQIGARDAARISCDYEVCGQQCCCGRFLKILQPVNMRMAKLQKATLDPSKISGFCGRLKCCLRYEDKTYRQLSKKLPNRKSRVKTPLGEGEVIDTQVLAQLVMVRDDEGSVYAVGAEEVETIANKGKKNKNNSRSRQNNNRNKSANQKAGKPENQNTDDTDDIIETDDTSETDEQEPIDE